MFVILSVLLGVGLAMDAFSVSVANGLAMPHLSKGKQTGMAGVYAGFQFAMPLVGWLCVHTIVEKFRSFEVAIPWIALVLLLFIGGKMVFEGIRFRRQGEDAPQAPATLGLGLLLLQGIATSIDALSVGFTIADYDWLRALICAGIIAVVTFVLCMIGVWIGKKIGERFTSTAQIVGGLILVGIGLEIWIKGLFF